MLKAPSTEKFFKILVFIGLLALVVVVFSQKIEFTAVDLGRHLENGKIVWQNPSILYHNVYSYTEPDFRFVNHHWLAGVTFYLVYLIGSFKLLSIFNIILILAAFSLAFRLASKRAGFYLTAVLAIPAVFLLSERVEVRPETFSYLFFVLTWFIIDKAADSKNYRFLWFLPPLFLIWANIHIYFFLGLALLGFKVLAEFGPAFLRTAGRFRIRFLAGLVLARPWLKIFLSASLACLVNPNFFRGLIYPFNIFNNYGYEVAENKSIFYLGHLMVNYNFFVFKWLLFLLVFSWAAYFIFVKKIRWFDFLISLFFASLALFASRNLALFALAAWLVISFNLIPPLAYLKENISVLDKFPPRRWQNYLAGLLLLVIIISVIFLIRDSERNNYFLKNEFGWGLSEGSTDSFQFFKSQKLSGPIFNNYDLGSALIFWLYPSEKVFVDNRPEAYSQDFFSSVYRPAQTDEQVWDEVSARYKFNTIYFSHTDFTPWANTFLTSILNDPDWALVYFDRYTVILLNKKTVAPEVWQKLAIDSWTFRNRLRELAAGSNLRTQFNLASLAGKASQSDLAEEIYRNLLFKYPGHSQVLASLGFLYSTRSAPEDLTTALDYFARSLKAGYSLPGIYNQMGLTNWQLKKYEAAAENWQAALRLDRNNTSALYYLDQVKKLRLSGELPFK